MTVYDVLFILLSGAAGGLLSGLYLNEGIIQLPRKLRPDAAGMARNQYHLGIFADIILGMGAGVIGALPLDLEFPKYIYVAMIAGFGGGNFIAKQAKLTAEDKARSADELPDLPEADPGTRHEVVLEIPERKGEEPK